MKCRHCGTPVSESEREVCNKCRDAIKENLFEINAEMDELGDLSESEIIKPL